jgi:hypothetical protein
MKLSGWSSSPLGENFINLNCVPFKMTYRRLANGSITREHRSATAAFFAGAGGAIVVIIGWQFGGAMWGTAAAVFAVITALYGLQELETLRIRNIERATEEVEEAEVTVNEIVEQEVFIQVEEDTGERDEEFTSDEFKA